MFNEETAFARPGRFPDTERPPRSPAAVAFFHRGIMPVRLLILHSLCYAAAQGKLLSEGLRGNATITDSCLPGVLFIHLSGMDCVPAKRAAS